MGNWLAKYPDFRKAVQEGRDVAQSLLRKAKGFTHPDVKILQIEGEAQEVPYNRYFPPDTQAAIFWLRSRRRKQWRKVIEHEHTVSDEKLRELEEAGGHQCGPREFNSRRKQNDQDFCYYFCMRGF
jgi:antibiotic biosynthesis monooxygenase (ABM) superfamily enzyme